MSGDRRRPSGNPGRAPVRIRTAGLADAAALLDLKRRLDQETSFMMFEAGEREASVQDLAQELVNVARSAKAPGCCGRR